MDTGKRTCGVSARLNGARATHMAGACLATTLTLLAFAAPSFATTTVNDCPVTETALKSDIAAAGDGGTVAFNCAAATTIPFDVAHGGTGTITIGTSVTLDASGSTGSVAFDGGGSVQLLVVNAAASLTVNTLRLSNGYTQYGPGAISGSGTVTVIDSTVSGNGGWGAVSNEWGNTLTITGSTFSGNSNPGGYGGAILQNSPAARPAGTTTITGSTFSNNSVVRAGSSGAGGAINIQRGTLNVTGSTFSGNSGSYDGGAIVNHGTATVDTTTFSGNSVSSYGGAISTTGSAAATTITNSVFSANTSSDLGGALDNQSGGTTNVTNSSLTGNTAPSGGGAISNYDFGGTNNAKLTISGTTFAQNRSNNGGAIYNIGSGSALTVRNTTFSANGSSATVYGGAIFNYYGSTATIAGSTFAGNASGYGAAIANYSGTLTIGASVIERVTTTVANCYNTGGTIVDSGYNLSNDSGSGCGFSAILRHDLVNRSASLTALGSNGGPTQTLALQLGSPAIDYIPLSTGLCGATDQRGFLRPDPGETACDIGAYEFQDQATVTALSSSQNPSTLGQAVTFTATVSPQSGAATPTGTVQFQVDGSNLGSPVALSGATAQSPSVSTLSAAGSPHTITATYTPAAGSGFAGSSKSLSQ
ncbi:MAG: hypothetical protein QOI47_1396, partial [Actinomycetota bacterium]|nr:hypothetical protein [Actinomycetota bacterium]